MSFGTTPIDPGTTPSVQIAVDAIASANYQRVKQANPNADQTGAYGIDADPVRVRPRRRGTADYDSGLVTIPVGPTTTVLTAATVYVESIFLHNLHATQVQKVTITNTADVELLKDYPLAPGEVFNLPRHSAELVGIKWKAENVNQVRGQITGAQ